MTHHERLKEGNARFVEDQLDGKIQNSLRKTVGIHHEEDHFEKLKPYISSDEYKYLMTKGNKASHLLSLQSKELLKLKLDGQIEDFRHMELEKMLGEFYTLQGKSERIKNFPFPRQYATVNFINRVESHLDSLNLN